MIKTWISVLWLTCSAQLPLQTPPKRYRRSPGCSKPVSLPSGRQIPLLWAIAAQTETQKRISLQDQLNIYNPCLCKYVLIKKSALGITPHLLVRSYSPAKVSQQVVCVAEVPVGSTLSGAISELLHYRQVRPEITVTVSLIRHRHIHIHQDRTVQSLTHSTRLPSSEPSSPPLGNLRAQLHSSRYFCLWHGTHSRSYTELAPDPPDTSTGRTCQSSGCLLNAPHKLQDVSV